MKKAIIGFIITCLFLLVYFLFSYLSKSEVDEKRDILSAIPLNTSVILRSDSYSELMEIVVQNSEMWSELVHIESIAEVNNNVFTLDSLTHRLLDDGDVLLDNEFAIAVINTGQGQFDFLYSVSFENTTEIEFANEFISAITPDSSNFEKRVYNGIEIESITYTEKQNESTFSYAFVGNIFIGSYSVGLVEASILQMASDLNLLNDPEFQKVQKTAGDNVDCNVYVNYSTIPKWLSCFLAPSYANAIERAPIVGTWGEWDTDVQNNGLLLNGFSSYSSDKGHFFSLFKNQKTVRMDITDILPANTSSFISIGLSDIEQFKTDMGVYLLNAEDGAQRMGHITSLNDEFGVDFPQVFTDILDEEMASVYTDINTVDVFENCFAVFQVKSKSMAEEAMLEVLQSYASLQKKPFNSFLQKVKIDNETEYDVYRMPVHYIPQKLFGDVFAHAKGTYMSFVDNHVVFSSSLRSMEKFIHSHVLGTDLDHDSSFGDFIDHLSNSYNVFVYGHIEHGLSLYGEFLPKDIKEQLLTNSKVLTKYQAVALQYAASQEMMYSNLYCYFNPDVDEKPRTVWESRLDSTVSFKPKLVETHVSSGKDILIQDKANNVYMLNKAGRILWKQNIDGQINSQIHHVDFYKNGKIQYAFSTENNIYIIDRIGNFVEHYPIRLKSRSTAGVSVFNYDGKKNYRFVIPCDDKRVYMYTKEGKILSGWEFGKTDGIVSSPIEHYSVDGKDYIVFADTYNMYILNRKGQKRITAKEAFEKAPNTPFYFEFSNGFTSERFVTTSMAGEVVSVYLDGTVEKVAMSDFSPKHFFELKDIDGDGRKDYVFLDEDELSVYRHNGNKLYDEKFDVEITQRPVIYKFSKKDVKIGVVDDQSHQIYLYNNDGELYKGFPLRGNTLFSIGVFNGGQGKFNLLVGSDENFLYNYRVN